MDRENALRVSSTGMGSREMVWAPDGKHLVYSSYLKEGGALLWARSDGAGEPQELYRGKAPLAYSLSQDGRALAFRDQEGILTLPLDLTDGDHPKPDKAEVFLKGDMLFAPAISPDGRWMAYIYQESGTSELYVQSFNGPTGRWPVSSGGAKYPVWSRNGRQLFYSTQDNYVMVVDCAPGRDSFASSKPRRWRDAPIHNASGYINFDLAPDGKRIVASPFVEREDVKGNLHLTFLVNFFDEVRRRMPR